MDLNSRTGQNDGPLFQKTPEASVGSYQQCVVHVMGFQTHVGTRVWVARVQVRV